MTGRSCAQLLLLLICVSATSVLGFKEHDFKKCKDAAFCARNRGQKGTKYSVAADSVEVHGATLSAVLRSDAGVQLNLTLRAYGPTLRLLVDELPSTGRYQVPDILMPGLQLKETPWEQQGIAKGAWTASVGDVRVKLTLASFTLEVSVGGKVAYVLNQRNMFQFEHRREKQEGDPAGWWEETFNGHGDSKKKGPEAISFDVTFPGAKHVYGLPERATDLALPPTAGSGVTSEPYRLYNLDVFEYLDRSPFGLYGSIPVLLAHQKGLTRGLFWLNAAEMFVDVESTYSGTNIQWITEAGVLDLFLLTGPSPSDVVTQYAGLTGTTAMPQLFSIGYHQCRWNYRDEADVEQVDAGFDEHAIPYDVLWLDIEHTNGKRYMTWDSAVFPHPVEMQEDVASRGRKMVTIVDPHVKRDLSYYVHKEAQELNHYVRNKDGGEFDGWCWPGSSSYLDVTSPVVREWWSTQFSLNKYKGSTKHLYIWNDMNEPSVFNGPEITMPKDALHYNDTEHRDIHNIFGYYYHLATSEGLIKRGQEIWGPDGDRPFVLSRAFFAGTQRVGPIWTGDNAAQWSHLAVSVPMLLTLGLAGLPNSGADVGGFFGNPDAELLTRWYQVGAYYPFFRGHAHLETQRREPWLFGEPTTSRIREAIRSRYAMLPYVYTLFRHANLTGAPIMRPLWYEFPDQQQLFDVQQEFMLGPAMLVRPVTTAGATTVMVQLPRGATWYEASTGTAWTGTGSSVKQSVSMDGIPVFYRGDSIVPRRERARRSTATQAADPFTLVVAVDPATGSATGDLYLDDGRSFAFARGQYLHRRFTYKDGRLTNEPEPQQPGVPPQQPPADLADLQVERIVVLGLPSRASYQAVSADGLELPTRAAAPSLQSASKNALVVQSRGLQLGSDWTVTISYAKAR